MKAEPYCEKRFTPELPTFREAIMQRYLSFQPKAAFDKKHNNHNFIRWQYLTFTTQKENISN